MAYILKEKITIARRAAGCWWLRYSITVTPRTIATILGSSTCLPPVHRVRALWVLSRQSLFMHMEEQEMLCPATGFKDPLKSGQNM